MPVILTLQMAGVAREERRTRISQDLLTPHPSEEMMLPWDVGSATVRRLVAGRLESSRAPVRIGPRCVTRVNRLGHRASPHPEGPFRRSGNPDEPPDLPRDQRGRTRHRPQLASFLRPDTAAVHRAQQIDLL